MAFTTANEDQLEIIDENGYFFIGKTDEWPNEPNGTVVLGYEDSYKQIMPVEYFELLGDSDEYKEKSNRDCARQMCIGSGVLKAPRGTDLCELQFCEGCHEKAKEKFRQLLEDNSHLGVSQFI